MGAYFRGEIVQRGAYLKVWHSSKGGIKVTKQKLTNGLFCKGNLLANKDVFIIIMKLAFLFAFLSVLKGSNAV